MPNDKQSAEQQATRWNEQYPVGTPVTVKLPSDKPGPRPVVSAKTCSLAYIKPLATPGNYWIAVVEIEGHGAAGLNSVKPQARC